MAGDVGFAVVGLGMGKHHCRSIAEAKDARLVAVCDMDAARMEPMVEKYGCKSYKSLDDLLKDDEVQVINIATPSGTHAELGIRVADAGKHIIVEKPADIHPDRIAALAEAGARNKVKIGCIFQSRLEPLNARIYETIQAGKLGRLIGLHGHLPWYRAQSYYDGPHGKWKGTWAMDGGGSLMNQGVHTMDLIQWFGGGVKSVMGMFGVFNHEIEAEDQTVALLRFQNGALGTIYTTTCCYPGFDQRITIYGTNGSILKTATELLSWKQLGEGGEEAEKEMMRLFGPKDESLGISSDPMALGADGHTLIVQDLVEAIREDRDPMIGLGSARKAVEIITAIFESGRTGKEVQVG
ncbi:MAG: Gfo/Idh/MocA family oxidoreductase [bacterium]|nr:Gfo/Idh/MocA family oxidoreductase [bacterium]